MIGKVYRLLLAWIVLSSGALAAGEDPAHKLEQAIESALEVFTGRKRERCRKRSSASASVSCSVKATI